MRSPSWRRSTPQSPSPTLSSARSSAPAPIATAPIATAVTSHSHPPPPQLVPLAEQASLCHFLTTVPEHESGPRSALNEDARDDEGRVHLVGAVSERKGAHAACDSWKPPAGRNGETPPRLLEAGSQGRRRPLSPEVPPPRPTLPLSGAASTDCQDGHRSSRLLDRRRPTRHCSFPRQRTAAERPASRAISEWSGRFRTAVMRWSGMTKAMVRDGHDPRDGDTTAKATANTTGRRRQTTGGDHFALTLTELRPAVEEVETAGG